MSLAALLMPELDDEMARTRKVLAAFSADKIDWSVIDASLR